MTYWKPALVAATGCALVACACALLLPASSGNVRSEGVVRAAAKTQSVVGEPEGELSTSTQETLSREDADSAAHLVAGAIHAAAPEMRREHAQSDMEALEKELLAMRERPLH